MIGKPIVIANPHVTLSFGLPHVPAHIESAELGLLNELQAEYVVLATGFVSMLTSVLLDPRQLDFAKRLVVTNAQMLRDEIQANPPTEGMNPSV